MDGHGVDIGVFPISAIGFDPGAVNFNANGTFGPFLKVVVVERLTHTGIAHTVVGAAPPAVAAGLAEGVAFGAGKEDVVNAIGACGVAETRVGGGDVIHHVGDGLVAVEAVAPGEGGIGPVDGHDGLVLTFTHPVEDVAGGDGSLNGNRFGHIGVEFDFHIVKATVIVGGEAVMGSVSALPKKSEAGIFGDIAVVAEVDSVEVCDAFIHGEGVDSGEVSGVVDDVANHQGGTRVCNAATVEGQHGLTKGMIEHGQDGETFAAIIDGILETGLIGAVKHLACDEGEVGIADFHAAVAVGAGGIADTGEIDGGGVGSGVVVGVEASVA